jgi:hypothetical protein
LNSYWFVADQTRQRKAGGKTHVEVFIYDSTRAPLGIRSQEPVPEWAVDINQDGLGGSCKHVMGHPFVGVPLAPDTRSVKTTIIVRMVINHCVA